MLPFDSVVRGVGREGTDKGIGWGIGIVPDNGDGRMICSRRSSTATRTAVHTAVRTAARTAARTAVRVGVAGGVEGILFLPFPQGIRLVAQRSDAL